jgi:hypothetical protein
MDDGHEEPVATVVEGLEAFAPCPPRRTYLPRLCVVIAVLCLVVGAAVVATSDDGQRARPVLAMGSGPEGAEIHSTAALDHAVLTTTTTVETTTTGATVGPAEGDIDGAEPSPPSASPLPPLRQTAPGVLDPYQWLTVESVDPCPPGSDLVEVVAWNVGGTLPEWHAGREQLLVDDDGRWSVELVIRAVGGIENVDVAIAAPELVVQTSCQRGVLWDDRNVVTADYVPVRVTQRPVTVVPELTATWDGHAMSMDLSGCPTMALGGLHIGAAPLGIPAGEDWDLMVGVHGDMTPGSEPGSWTHRIELPGYDPTEGLWAYAYCTTDSQFRSIIWRSLPFELDPPG